MMGITLKCDRVVVFLPSCSSTITLHKYLGPNTVRMKTEKYETPSKVCLPTAGRKHFNIPDFQ